MPKVHHCPFCSTPLNTPQTRSRCLGEHVGWCKQYHNQLFKKGTSSQCHPCRTTDEQHIEQHIKRHRKIAEKIHELKQLKQTYPLTPRSINAFSSPGMDSLLTNKERKAAKKAEKISKMAKVVGSADIEFVARVLHPEDPEDDLEIVRQLVDEPDVQLNKFFHKGTGNTTEMRRAFVKKREHMMIRKAGFWRWASRKPYKRLVQHGKIWSDRNDDNSSSRNHDITRSSSNAVGVAEAAIVEVLDDAVESTTCCPPLIAALEC